jgi:hypothetical protein
MGRLQVCLPSMLPEGCRLRTMPVEVGVQCTPRASRAKHQNPSTDFAVNGPLCYNPICDGVHCTPRPCPAPREWWQGFLSLYYAQNTLGVKQHAFCRVGCLTRHRSQWAQRGISVPDLALRPLPSSRVGTGVQENIFQRHGCSLDPL